jgi:hypothetical protein
VCIWLPFAPHDASSARWRRASRPAGRPIEPRSRVPPGYASTPVRRKRLCLKPGQPPAPTRRRPDLGLGPALDMPCQRPLHPQDAGDAVRGTAIESFPTLAPISDADERTRMHARAGRPRALPCAVRARGGVDVYPVATAEKRLAWECQFSVAARLPRSGATGAEWLA